MKCKSWKRSCCVNWWKKPGFRSRFPRWPRKPLQLSLAYIQWEVVLSNPWSWDLEPAPIWADVAVTQCAVHNGSHKCHTINACFSVCIHSFILPYVSSVKIVVKTPTAHPASFPLTSKSQCVFFYFANLANQPLCTYHWCSPTLQPVQSVITLQSLDSYASSADFMSWRCFTEFNLKPWRVFALSKALLLSERSLLFVCTLVFPSWNEDVCDLFRVLMKCKLCAWIEFPETFIRHFISLLSLTLFPISGFIHLKRGGTWKERLKKAQFFLFGSNWWPMPFWAQPLKLKSKWKWNSYF